jgi:hypothetical protein
VDVESSVSVMEESGRMRDGTERDGTGRNGTDCTCHHVNIFTMTSILMSTRWNRVEEQTVL